MPTAPPDLPLLLDLLVRHDFRAPLPKVAAFLVSALDAAPGTAAGADDRVVWVGDHAERYRPSVRGIAEAALAAARAAHRPGATYLDLRGGEEHWVKLLRSGWRQVAFGPDLLWGTPRISVESGADAADVAVFVRAWRTGPTMTYPAILAGPDGRPVLVDGTTRRVVLRTAEAADDVADPQTRPAALGPVTAEVAADDIAARLGGTVAGLDRSPVDLRWTARVEVPRVGAVEVRFALLDGGYQLARRPTSGSRVGDRTLPEGFCHLWQGPDPSLLHLPSGIVTEPLPPEATS